ncbi:MAG: deoxyribose-phosphate aldolase [Spirochaetes bacterium]|nr:MAG: deoxyribose-phosphate aldolase [Spirochaetota bacterium]
MCKTLTVKDIAKMIDHSLLRPTLADSEFREGIELAGKYKCATVCVAPYDVARAVDMLSGSEVLISTVIDFPHGSNLTESKVFQVERAVEKGARELDMVLAISRLVSKDYGYVEDDIRAVVEAAHSLGAVLKVIFENCYLNPELIVEACRICEKTGADYAKTSTGYGPGGARLEDVRLMRKSLSAKVAVKAAGGIRTLDELLAYRAAGAKMIGTRATAPILDEAEKREAEGNLKEME